MKRVYFIRRGESMRQIAATQGCNHRSVSMLLRRHGVIRSREEAETFRVQAVRRANARRAQDRAMAA